MFQMDQRSKDSRESGIERDADVDVLPRAEDAVGRLDQEQWVLGGAGGGVGELVISAGRAGGHLGSAVDALKG
jgi:hypothetical protein